MKAKANFDNGTDVNGNPAGGFYQSKGIDIVWQNGPLGRDGDRTEPNGAFVENVVDAAIKRIQFYQDSKFNCRENAIALTHLETAALWLNKRTQDREERKVEGTHKQ
jgi:hypothetical protein